MNLTINQYNSSYPLSGSQTDSPAGYKNRFRTAPSGRQASRHDKNQIAASGINVRTIK